MSNLIARIKKYFYYKRVMRQAAERYRQIHGRYPNE